MNESFCKEYVGEGRADENSSPIFIIFSYVLLVPSVVIILCCYFYFYQNYCKYQYTKTRNIFLLTMFTIGIIILVFNYCIRGIIGSVNFSCRAYSLILSAQSILILQVTWIRLFSLLWRVNYNKLLINQTYLALKNGDLKQNPGSVRFVELGSRKMRKNTYYAAAFENGDGYQNSVIAIKNPASHKFGNFKNHFFSFLLFDMLRIKASKKYPLNIRIAGVFASPTFASVFFVFLLVISTTIFISVEFYYLPLGQDCVNCSITPAIIVSSGILALTFILMLYGIVRVVKIYDSFGIRKELLVLGSLFIILQFAIISPITFLAPEIDRDGNFDLSYLIVLYVVGASIYMFPYQIWVAKKLASSNNRGEDDEELLKKLLEHEEGKQAFSLYLACSLSLENLFFYEAATNWKQTYPKLEAELQQTSAEQIYAQFLSEEALLLINVSDNCKTDIKDQIESGLKESTFDAAITTVWIHMANDIFPRFKKTAYFKASRNEIQNV